MTAHVTLKDSLRQAVSAAGQPETVYRRLEAWLDALSSGDLDIIKDREETLSRMQELLDCIEDSEVSNEA